MVCDNTVMPRSRHASQFNTASAKAISLDAAVTLFDRLAARKDISYGYAEAGCYARAHLMCEQMWQEGHVPHKAWAFETGKNNPLKVELPHLKDPVLWCFHVAPALPVMMPNGKTQMMVFDPSLFDGPATVGEWAHIMGTREAKVKLVNFGGSPRYGLGDYQPGKHPDCWTSEKTSTQALSQMKQYLKWEKEILSGAPRPVFQGSGRSLAQQSSAPPSAEQNWVAHEQPAQQKRSLKQLLPFVQRA